MSALAPTLQAFFTDRLVQQHHASPHTIAAYRDAWRLLLRFAATHLAKAPSQLEISDLDAPLIGRFLAHLEHDRANTVRTRNARLSAVHALFRYAALEHPECWRARGPAKFWTRVDRKMLWSPPASSAQQRARVLTGVKARRYAPPPLRGSDGLDAGSAHARPDWLLPTMPTHAPPTCCGRRSVQNDALSGDR